MAVCKVCGNNSRQGDYCFRHKKRKPIKKTPIKRVPFKRGAKKKPYSKRAPREKQDPLKKDLWDWYSRWNRLFHSDENGYCKCFTCDKIGFWKSDGIQCGHFISRKWMRTFIHHLNTHPQCIGCNKHRSGEQYKYSMELDKVYGPGTAETLYILSKEDFKYTKAEYLELIEYYKTETFKLLKSKGLKL